MFNKSLKIVISIIFILLILFLILVFTGSRIFTDYLWFDSLGYVHTFLVMFFANFSIRIIIGIIFTVFIFVNLFYTKGLILKLANINNDSEIEQIYSNEKQEILKWINQKRLIIIFFLISAFVGFVFSSIGQDAWKIVLRYFNQTPFNLSDPIFARDIGFYVFSLPFFNFIKEMGMLLIGLTIIITGVIYFLASGISSLEDLKFKLSSKAKGHITILITLFLFLKAWDYRLSMYELLYSARGVAFGASYTDINANLLGLRILFVIAIVIGVLFLISLFRKNYKIILWGLGIWLITSIIFGSVYPGFVQRFQVEPNELERERQYISHNIEMTRTAYGLDNVQVQRFQVDNDLDAEALGRNIEVIDSIRVWDYRPKLASYREIQELRPYYSFVDMDIDRYTINGNFQQVMLSAREMDQTRLPSRTWINETLIYTHGYGLAMSPVNRATPDGMPDYLIKDIPPITETDLDIENVALYYGEKTDKYVIANTDVQEFHYTDGEDNVYHHYTGDGGVTINNLFRKLLFSLRFNEFKIFLSDDIHQESRILFHRNIHERVRKVAPFLEYDRDPYLVLADGDLFWIQDAYTTTNKYPYSQPYGNINYIRNSIKIVINAYTGNMDFYIIDEEDPLAQTYKNIFPDLFVSGEEMPESIRNHIRYPQDIFSIQSEIYKLYHITKPTTFYNQEDLWDLPTEQYDGRSIRMEPYYILNKLSGEDSSEFMLMLPFTPAGRNNMVSWLAARSDGENYGELYLNRFPTDEHVHGHQQIESAIDANDQISQILSLWDQRGSRVIRGNLLVIPIENSILYIEPVYIEAEEVRIPELRRVIVGFDGRIVMAPTLDQGLTQLFGEFRDDVIEPEIEDRVPFEGDVQIPEAVRNYAEQALSIYQDMQESQREGNWSRYGELIQQLEEILIQMQQIDQELPEEEQFNDSDLLETELDNGNF